MASVSTIYLTSNGSSTCEQKKSRSAKTSALVYSTRIDLLPLLMATENEIDSLPIVYLREAKA
jgi:hypothetical protein